MLILYFYLHFFPFYINFISDESPASNQLSRTRSRRGFSRRARSSTRSRLGFSRRAKTHTRSRRGFSKRAKTRTRGVVLSPRSTALLTTPVILRGSLCAMVDPESGEKFQMLWGCTYRILIIMDSAQITDPALKPDLHFVPSRFVSLNFVFLEH
jgi:hypothetical protein